MTQTIKEYLAKAIEKNDRLCKLGNGDMDGNSNGNVIAQDIRLYLSAIEAKLDAPMKSAEEWLKKINYFPDLAGNNRRHLIQSIRAIQADAIASRLQEVDVDDFINQVMDDEELVIEIMGDAQRMFREWDRKRGPTQTVKPQDGSDYWCVVAALKRAALLKARRETP